MPKPIGERGSWFAKWRGERLPCVHRCWTVGTWPHYADPEVEADGKWPPFIEALRDGKAILTDGTSDVRTGYVGVYRIDNVEVRDGLLQFDFKERLADFR